jgi:hypothetical protein
MKLGDAWRVGLETIENLQAFLNESNYPHLTLPSLAIDYIIKLTKMPFDAHDLLKLHEEKQRLAFELEKLDYNHPKFNEVFNEYKKAEITLELLIEGNAKLGNRVYDDVVSVADIVADLSGLLARIANLIGATFNAVDFAVKLYELACRCDPANPNGGTQGQCNLPISPIVLNLDSDVTNDVLSLNDSNSYFDMNAWGVANKTGWVSPTDGLLVSDFNANGQIDDVGELFGDKSYKNGFEQLRAEADSNNDGKIDSNDELYNTLKVWVDANGDGVAQNDELHSLKELDIASINLNHTAAGGKQGGDVIAAGSYTKQDGTTGEARDYLFDVSMKDSTYQGDYEITDEIKALLPNINGFGSFKDLHVAMAIDSNLYQFVKDNMTDLNSMDTNFNTFMMKWSGLEAKQTEQYE